MPGVTTQELFRAVAESGVMAGAGRDVADWVARRLTAYRAGAGAAEETLSDGRILDIRRYKTFSNGRVILLRDVTDACAAER